MRSPVLGQYDSKPSCRRPRFHLPMSPTKYPHLPMSSPSKHPEFLVLTCPRQSFLQILSLERIISILSRRSLSETCFGDKCFILPLVEEQERNNIETLTTFGPGAAEIYVLTFFERNFCFYLLFSFVGSYNLNPSFRQPPFTQASMWGVLCTEASVPFVSSYVYSLLLPSSPPLYTSFAFSSPFLSFLLFFLVFFFSPLPFCLLLFLFSSSV